MRTLQMKQVLKCLFVLMLITTKLSAQVTTSSLVGTVSIAKEAKSKTLVTLEGVTVKAVHQPTGTIFTTTSKKNGEFTIASMKVGGPYHIEFSYVGFEKSVYDDIYLKLDESYVINTTLKDKSSLADVVVNTTITNKNSLLNANRTGAVTNISSRQIINMPSISRSLNDLTRLTPQASSTNVGAVAGGNYRQNYITVDGSDFNNTFGIGNNLPAGGSPISLDALEEISINISPFDVKQSGFIGSALNAVTRSGTNKLSGSVYTFFRNENQQGNQVAKNDPLTLQKLSVNQTGFRLGGSIIKNKLFFFVNYESGKTIRPGQQNVAATTANPFGSAPNVARPTEDSLNIISAYLKSKYNYETGGYQGYSNESSNTRFVARIDWNISSKHRLNVRYSQVESKSPSFVSTSRSPLTAFASSAGRQSINALWFKNSNYFQEANFYSLAAELNSSFGKFSNTLRISRTHQNDPRSSESSIFPFVDILKDGTPYTSFGYEPFSYGNLRDVKSYSLVDNLTWRSGKHNYTVGLQADLQTTKNGFQRFGTSYYTFASYSDFINGNKPQDFAITYSLLPNYEQAFPTFKFAQYSVYGQDEITLSKKLKITAGLRIDLPQYLSTKEIKTHPLVNALTFANNENINTGTLPKTTLLFSPRIGFNWDVYGNRSLQVRGGTGIFTGRIPTVWLVAQSGDAGLIQFTQTYTGAANTPGAFNPDPFAYRPAVQPTPGSAIPSTVSAIDKNFKFPQTWKSSVALDAKLPFGIVGTIEGIYNKDLNVALGRNPNLVTPQALNVTGYADNRPIYPSANKDKFINPLTAAGQAVANGSSTGTGAFNPVVLYNGTKGHYWSLTGKLEKQFKNGFSAMAAYTHSQAKQLFDGSGDQLLNTWSGTPIVNNSNNPELSYTNNVVPDRFIVSLSYRKEYLKHLATSISLFFESSISGRFSYTYGADFNRDGQTNDLIYVPKDASEITFTNFTYNGVVYTAAQQSDIFFKYIGNDKYLRTRKGKYAERNGAKLPWRNQMDIRIAQDIFTNIGGQRNSLQFTLDIFNFGNLLNKSWGIYKLVNASSILVPTNTSSLVAGGTVKPTFRLQTDRNAPVSSTFRDDNSINSTYYMQFGLRYSF